jgi:hypothetical protein
VYLYHGSNVEIKSIDLKLSKPNKDFGKGFYLSDNYKQAYEMAIFKTELFGGTAIVTKFEFDEKKLTDDSFKILRFTEYSKEWAEFVFKNRNQKNDMSSQDYDIIIGPIANDRVGIQIRRYMENEIDLDTFIEKIKFMKGITIQFFFGTQKAVDLLKNRGICNE